VFSILSSQLKRPVCVIACTGRATATTVARLCPVLPGTDWEGNTFFPPQTSPPSPEEPRRNGRPTRKLTAHGMTDALFSMKRRQRVKKKSKPSSGTASRKQAVPFAATYKPPQPDQTPEEGRLPRVQFSVEPSLFRHIVAESKKQGKSISNYIVDLLRNGEAITENPCLVEKRACLQRANAHGRKRKPRAPQPRAQRPATN